MNFPSRTQLQAARKARPGRDLVVAVVIPLIFLLFAIIFDFSERFVAWVGSVEAWEADELVLSTFVLSLTLAWFAYRRWRDLIAEITERKRVEEGLLENRASYQSVVNNIKEIIFQTDKAGLWTLLNPAWTEITGFTLEESIGQNFLDFIHPDDRKYNLQMFRPLIERQKEYCRHEIRYLTKAGAEQKDPVEHFRWIEVHARLTLDDDDNITGTAGTLRDITELKRAEAALRQAQADLEKRVEERTGALSEANKALKEEIAERRRTQEALQQSEERFRQLAENIRQVFWMSDPSQAAILYISPAYEEIWGRSCQSLYEQPQSFLEAIHPEDRDSVLVSQSEQLLGHSTVTEYRVIQPDGLIRWVRDHGFPIRNTDGEVYRIAGVAEDITARKQAQEAQKQAEQRYRNLFEEAPLMYVITRDQSGQPIITDCNQSFLSTLGYSRAEVLERPLANFYTPDSRTKLLEGGYQRALTDGFASEERQLVTHDGHIIETLLQALPEIGPTGEVSGTRAMFVDISQRVRAEAEIRYRNRELTLLNQIIAASAADIALETLLETTCRELALTFDVPLTTIILLSEDRVQIRHLAEYSDKEQPALLYQTVPRSINPAVQYLIGHEVPLVIHDAQSNPHLREIRDLLRQRGTVAFLLVPIMVNGQVVGKLSLEALEPRDFSAEELSLAWNVADQLAGALARARLIQTQQRLTTVVEQSVESVLICDTRGNIIYVNPAFEQISGYSSAEIVGQNLRALYAFEQDQALIEQTWAAVSSGQVWQGRMVSQTKEGKSYTEDVIFSPVRDESEVIVNYVVIKRDVTRELQLEEQYHQSQKMEAIGQLAGGIAHDFNNLLTVINGYSEFLLEGDFKAADSSRKYLKEILLAGERAASLTRQLLAFSRRQVLQPQVLNLNTVVVQMDNMLRRLISEDIELTTLLAPNLTLIKADPGQLEQVLLNLVVNARDAMPDGGKLTIETANATLDQVYASQYAEVEPGEYALITVSDTGVGMTEEVKTHIFEPFFTTKDQGKGTGLGLATCFGIVKQSGGHINLYSEPDQGTTFKIYFPATTAAVASVLERNEAKPLPQGTETILLVEDGAAVRALAAELLREQGYLVLEAANGAEALGLAQTQAWPEIHLLLTDVIMPQMGGKELADRLKDEYTNLKVLFTSGYTDDTIVRHGVLEPGVAFLEKPYTMATLIHKVRDVLDA